MAEIAFSGQQNTVGPDYDLTMGAPLYQRGQVDGPVELLPNPDFVFPRRDLTASQDISTPANPTARRPASCQDLSASAEDLTAPRRHPRSMQRKSASTLPSFNFNPSATSTAAPKTVITPPHSPALSSPSTPSRAMGHRRGGSEFIGGDARPGSVALLSSSPSKADPVGPDSGLSLQPSTAGPRRGHAHRRSGAISSHDLSTILQPTSSNAQNRTGSAPTTPLEPNGKPFDIDDRKTRSQPSLQQSPQLGDDGATTPPRPRTRVGFSDKVEYIRPLSTISSETESSMSTIRGHSVSGSFSSIISGGSPPSARKVRPSLDTAFEDELERRPSTASGVLDSPVTRPFGGELAASRPKSAHATSSPTSKLPAFSFGRPPTPPSHQRYRRSPKSNEASENQSSTLSRPSGSSGSSHVPNASQMSLQFPIDGNRKLRSKSHERDGSPQRKAKKPRRVRSWASSIILRKPKHCENKPTELLRSSGSLSPEDAAALPLPLSPMDFDAVPDFDVNNTVTIVTPPVTTPDESRDYFERSHRRSASLDLADTDSRSPIIDLDAALGPFNTPSAGSPLRSPMRGFSSGKRKLHSGEFRGPYSGLGLLNHRRTESAPELVPFEARNSTIATMADVFEEDEDAYTAMSDTPMSGAGSVTSIPEEEEEEEEEEPGIGIQVVDTDDAGSPVMKWNFDEALKDQSRGRGIPIDSPRSLSLTTSSIPPQASPDEMSVCQNESPVEIVEDFEEPRAASLPRSSDSTITPILTPAADGKEPAPLMSLGLPLPQDHLMTPDTVTSSSFSSPDFRSSQTSFDTSRLGTATSSITDARTAASSLIGEPGPEFRVSVDDVPSLTSSRSTMNSGVNHTSPTGARMAADRSASIASESSTTLDARRKRSSIASLSNLVGRTFGERSKLSIEQRPSTECEDTPRPAKTKKSKNRLSKMMHFWKSKESLRSS